MSNYGKYNVAQLLDLLDGCWDDEEADQIKDELRSRRYAI